MLRRFFQDYKQLEGKAVEVDEIQACRRTRCPSSRTRWRATASSGGRALRSRDGVGASRNRLAAIYYLVQSSLHPAILPQLG